MTDTDGSDLYQFPIEIRLKAGFCYMPTCFGMHPLREEKEMTSQLSREELVLAASTLAKMIEGEWPSSLSYAIEVWWTHWPDKPSAEELAAVRKLEKYLEEREK